MLSGSPDYLAREAGHMETPGGCDTSWMQRQCSGVTDPSQHQAEQKNHPPNLPNHEKITSCGFKPLVLGAVCYAAIDDRRGGFHVSASKKE